MNKLKIRVQELVYKGKYVILWNHIKQQHPNITKQEILNGLIYDPIRQIKIMKDTIYHGHTAVNG